MGKGGDRMGAGDKPALQLFPMLPSELPQPLAEGNEYWSCLNQIFNLSVAHALFSTQSLSSLLNVGCLQKRCVRNANPLQ